MIATVTLQPFAIFADAEQPVIVLVALLVCLIPTTIGALLSAIGIAGMDRMVQRNVLAMSGRAVEAAGDCATLLLDKTGTITFGAPAGRRVPPCRRCRRTPTLADAAQLSSLADETPEGRSIVVLAKERYGIRERELQGATLVAFTAETRMSGVDLQDGRASARAQPTRCDAGSRSRAAPCRPRSARPSTRSRARAGRRSSSPRRRRARGTPPARALGVIYLKDIVKPGIADRFADLRTWASAP